MKQSPEVCARISATLKKYYAKQSIKKRREITAAARAKLAETGAQKEPNRRRMNEFWKDKSPEERSALMRERALKDPHNTPARIKARKKAYPKQKKALLAGAERWRQENPAITFERGQHMGNHPNAKKARDAYFAKRDANRAAKKADEERRKAYTENLHIKYKPIVDDNQTEDDFDEFFGEGF